MLVPNKPFQPNPMFRDKGGAPLLGRLLSLPTNIRLGWKGLSKTSTLADYKHSSITDAKSYMTLGLAYYATDLITTAKSIVRPTP